MTAGEFELVDRQIALDAGHRRMVEAIARRAAHPRHFRQHREVLGIVDPVELGLVGGRDVELDEEKVRSRSRRAERGSGGPLEYAVPAVCRVRPDLRLPFARIGGFGPGRAVDHRGIVDLVDRQIARDAGHRRMVEPIARAGPHARHLEDRRHVILVVDAVELGFERRRNIHLHDIDVGHRAIPPLGY